MKALVLSAAYLTPDGKRAMSFVHTRCIAYKKAGFDVTVLNFGIKTGYMIDGIQVISLNEFKKMDEKYDVLVSHAANLRCHYRFLFFYGGRFPKKVFIFHGHEILHLAKYYPKSYPYMKRGLVGHCLRYFYDSFKLKVWNHYYKANIEQIKLVFVSFWLYEQFVKEVGIDEAILKGHYEVIPNNISAFFESHSYFLVQPKYDFITIRSNLDESKYCVDLVVEAARKNPQYKFCIVGRGKFFAYNEKPENVDWNEGVFNHNQLAELINCARYALMPTREDTHGVMACEMAAYGIPLITSNISITQEVFSDCKTVAFVSNEDMNLARAVKELSALKDSTEKWERYFAKNTVDKEIEFISHYVKE